PRLDSSARAHGTRGALSAPDAVSATEHILAGGLHADREGSGQDGSLAEGRDLEPGRERKPFGELATNRVEQEVAVGTDAASEDDQLDIRNGGEGRDVQGDPACDLADDGARALVAFACGAEDRPRVLGAADELRRQLGDLRRCRIDAVERDQGEVDLARGAVAAAVELAAEDHARAHAGSAPDEDEG